MQATNEQKQQGRKIPVPLWLLFVGADGPGSVAANRALQTIPGVRVRRFTDADDALTWAADKDVVAAVVDERLPTMSGAAFIRRWHTGVGLPRAHTILLSDAPRPSASGAVGGLGVDDVVHSTAPPGAIAALVKSAIGLRLAERASWLRTGILEQSPAWAHPVPAPQTVWLKRLGIATLLLALLLAAVLWRTQTKPPSATAGAPIPGIVAGLPPADSHPSKGAAGKLPSGHAPGGGAGAVAGAGRGPDALAAQGSSAAGAAAAGASNAGASNAAAAGATAGLSALLPPHTGALVLDAAGNAIAQSGPDLPRVPASTAKVLTAVTAIDVLGSRFRFVTRLVQHGAVRNGVLAGTLALVGSGDPVLRTADLDAAAAAIARSGVHRIHGNLLVDATAFTAPEYNVHWLPSDRPFYYAAGTSAISVDEGMSGPTTVMNQRLYAGIVLRSVLRAHGIVVDGATRYGAAAGGIIRWTHVSPPLTALIAKMLAQSDNHVAEQLLRKIGLVSTGVGSEAAGIARVRRELLERGVSTRGLLLYDGSGLSRDDRVTPRTLATLLWKIRGTQTGNALRDALPNVGSQGDIVAKTGRVGNAEGLMGYLERRPAGSYSFAFLGTAASSANVVQLQNDQVRALRDVARRGRAFHP